MYKMFLILVLSALAFCGSAEEKESALLRLSDVPAAEAFIDSAELVVVGFFESNESRGYKEFLDGVAEAKTIPAALCSEKEVWAKYNIDTDSISIFRKADTHQETLTVSRVKNLDKDGVFRFFTINNLRYLTEYNQMSAVGLFQSKVKVHLILFSNKGSKNHKKLQDIMRAVAPKYTGKMLFILIDGKEKTNERSMGYFGLKPHDLPRVGLYDLPSDRSYLMTEGEITTEHVQNFCDSFLSGELQKQKEAKEAEKKTEL